MRWPFGSTRREQQLREQLAASRRGEAYAKRQLEAASTNRLNRAHWLQMKNGAPDALLLPDLDVIRSRTIWECLNSGYAAGLQRSYHEDCVGPNGPRLQVHVPLAADASDVERAAAKKFADELETGFWDWSRRADRSGNRGGLRHLLNQGVDQFWHSGEFFWQLVQDPQAAGPVRMRLLAIHPARVATPADKFSDPLVRNGIRIDEAGAPVEYYVFRDLPGLPFRAAEALKYNTIPAKDMLHVFYPLLPGQTRGYPWLAPVLSIFAELRDLTADTLTAAHVAAMTAVYFQRQANFGGNPLNSDGEVDLTIQDIEPGTGTELPEGVTAFQVKPEHPTTTYDTFKRELLSEIGRPVGVPYMRIASDARLHTYSSARIDLQAYWRGVECTQGLLAEQALDPVLELILRELVLARGLRPPARWSASWIWPAMPHVDPTKEADAQKIRLQIGVTTLARECLRDGQDWEEVIAQREREAEALKKAKLPAPWTIDPPPRAPEPPAEAEEEPPAAEPAAAGRRPRAQES